MQRAASTLAPATIAHALTWQSAWVAPSSSWRRRPFTVEVTIAGHVYAIRRDDECKPGELVIDGDRLYSAAWL